jgi:transaldolase
VQQADDPDALHPVVTLMVGRMDDQLERAEAASPTGIDPTYLAWSGIAVFKRTASLFREHGYRSRLLAAAYRRPEHWSQIIGTDVLQSIPYDHWRAFAELDTPPALTLDTPVRPEIIDALLKHHPDFVQGYEPDGLQPQRFARYPAAAHTLNQFIQGYEGLLAIVRKQMLGV